MIRPLLAAILVMVAAMQAGAVQPEEMLDDPSLEARARGITEDLRCLVCQNQSIDDSNAALARDLRLLVRERLLAGDSDAEAVDYVVARYGDYVLLRPPMKPTTWLLWFGPAVALVGAGTAVALWLRRRGRTPVEAEPELTPEERRRVDDLVSGERGPP